MQTGYEAYCLSDPDFYDSPTVSRGDDVDFEVARGAAPDGWGRFELDDWLVYGPKEVERPKQGWKIHASACIDNAEEVLRATWDYCVGRRIPFKFIRSRQLLVLRNTKYAHRGGSGKFITIYPADEGELEVILNELGAILDGQPGPYILSDLRWGSGPLYVRYGGFADLYCVGENGELAPAIADPDGRLVPDERGPTFSMPPWVTLPTFLEPHMEARNSATVTEIPYRIEEALHYSNGGGVYLAVDARSDRKVVLKEARPHAGLAWDLSDAVARLHHEREMLERLSGLGVAPEVLDHFTLGDHHFVVLEYVESKPLRAALVERFPLVQQETDEATAAEYTDWVLETHRRVEQAVDAVHSRGVVLGDLHPYNTMLRPDGEVAVLDLEVAMDLADERLPALNDPAFMAPASQKGFDVDRYALACLRLYMFMPLTMLFVIDPGKAPEIADAIAGLFPVPRPFLDEAVEVITKAHGEGPARARPPRLEPDGGGWERIRESMHKAILASATPTRQDRLFPGDINQFSTNGLNLAFGAAGVLYALAATGAERQPELEDWLVVRATSRESGTRVGFYDGLHGAAYALERLGRRDEALEVLAICVDELEGKFEHFGLDLFAGLAGMGLNLAHFAAVTGDPALWDASQEVAQIVATRLGAEDSVPTVAGGDHPEAGLFRGSTGPALMFIRLFERTGDEGYLDLAATALRQDLRRCLVRDDDGSLEINGGWRTMPYLAEGSVGIGIVLDDYLRHREDERFAESAARIRLAAESQIYVDAGLFWGRAGMLPYLSRRHPPGTAAQADRYVARHVRFFDWHALTYRGHLAFPGEQLLRLSMDLATGTAGVLLALGSALHPEPVELPFLPTLHDRDHAAGKNLEPIGKEVS